MSGKTTEIINGIDTDGLHQYISTITKIPSEGISSYGIKVEWKEGVRMEITSLNQRVGNTEIEKDFRFTIDESNELLGSNCSISTRIPSR